MMKKNTWVKILIIIIAVSAFFGFAGFRPKGRVFDIKIKDNRNIIFEKSYDINLKTYIKVMVKYKGDFSDFYLKNKQEEDFNLLSEINDEIEKDIDKVISKYELEPTDAKVKSFKNGQFSYESEKNGFEIDKQKLVENIAFSINNGQTIILDKQDIKPKTSVEALKKHNLKMSEFKTYYKTSSSARKKNIQLALKKLDNKKVLPFSTLSFNQTVGKRTESNGFLKGKIIYNGEFVDGIGGGVCQVSSTLYVAWINAGLAVKSSRSHSQKVSYLRQGFDTTVTEWCDLVLYNDTVYPIYVDTFYDDEKIGIAVYGTPLNCTIKLDTEKVKEIKTDEYERILVDENNEIISKNGKEIDKEDKQIIDIEWQDNESEKTMREPKNGEIYNSYRNYYLGNKLIYSEFLRKNYYAPVKGKIVCRKTTE